MIYHCWRLLLSPLSSSDRITDNTTFCSALPKNRFEVLDLCCGGGLYPFALEKAGYRMTGLDMEPRMLKAARKYAEQRGSKARFVGVDPISDSHTSDKSTVRTSGQG
jgi:2-polyprenyl-3-methyl-5-hydroxy-6-metoxy-1,4-benzoquinol methylase